LWGFLLFTIIYLNLLTERSPTTSKETEARGICSRNDEELASGETRFGNSIFFFTFHSFYVRYATDVCNRNTYIIIVKYSFQSQFWKKGLDSTRSLENRYQLKKSEKTKIEKEYKNQQAQTDLRFHEAFGAALVAASIKDSIKMTLPVDQRDAFEDMFEGLQKLKLEEKKKKKQE